METKRLLLKVREYKKRDYRQSRRQEKRRKGAIKPNQAPEDSQWLDQGRVQHEETSHTIIKLQVHLQAVNWEDSNLVSKESRASEKLLTSPCQTWSTTTYVMLSTRE